MRSLQWPCTCMNGNSYRKRATTTVFGSRRSERGCVRTETTTRTQTTRRYGIVLFLPSRPFFSSPPLLQIDPSSPVQSSSHCGLFLSSEDYLPSVFCNINSDRQRIVPDRLSPARPIALWPNVTQRLCVIKKKKGSCMRVGGRRRDRAH